MKQEKFILKKRGGVKIKYKYKKEILLLLLIFSFIIILEVFMNKNLDKNLKEIRNLLDKIKEEINLLNYEEESIDVLLVKWKEKYDVFALYSKHNDLDEITNEIIKLKMNVECENKEQCLKNIENIIFLGDNLIQKNELNLKNIF
jgi:hypothetical protein